MDKIRVGLIGCGNIGARYDEKAHQTDIFTHAGMYRANDAFQLVCAAEPDRSRRREFGQFWGVTRLYADHQELLRKETLDILSVATPDHTHHDILTDILNLNAPRVILTEKPVAETLADAEQLAVLAADRQTAIFVDYIRRWDANHQKARQFLQEKRLGSIQSIVGYYVRGIRHNGCQMINLLQYLLGPIRQVRVWGPRDAGSLEGDPSLNVLCGFDDHLSAQMIGVDQQGYGFSIFELDIIGTAGRLRIVEGGQTFAYSQVDTDPQFVNFKQLTPSPVEWPRSTYGMAMKNVGKQLEAFIRGAPVALVNTLPVAISDLNVIDAIMKASQHDTFEQIDP